jgi:quinohemoprotein ethanol dehydrogenase
MEGRRRRVLLQAAKDGFLYVLDARTGKVLEARNFTFVNWTRGLDPRTHRPIINSTVNYYGHPALVWPSAAGAHSWQPMSFDADTGLVYIPVLETPNVWINLAPRPARYSDGWFATQGIFPPDYDPKDTVRLYGPLPSLKALERRYSGPAKPRGALIAWDPIHERRVWEAPGASIWDGGVMSTAGGLVFQGDTSGRLNVYSADTGSLLRSVDVGTSIMAAPVAYRISGVEYIAFMAGLGGGDGFAFDPSTAAYRYGNAGRIVALKLGGGAVPKAPEVTEAPYPRPLAPPGPRARVLAGELLYTKVCSRCHVFGRGLVPDLRRMPPGIYHLFPDIVLRGLLSKEGMESFADELTARDVSAIRAYITAEAWSAYRAQKVSHTPAAH